ncbi:hypothetical protein ACS0TY_004390 [Phlomoides rotata]
MRIYSSRLIHSLMIMVIIIFTIIQLSSCREFPRETTIRGASSRLRTHFSSYFPAPSPKKSRNNGDDSSYRVSNRKTPGGPNPLHN